MLADHQQRFSRLERLREKHKFGISQEIIDLSHSRQLENADANTVEYVQQASPDELLGHLTNIPQFDLREDIDFGSTPAEELQQRYRDLQYRAKWLKALLNVTQEELTLFEDALKQKEP